MSERRLHIALVGTRGVPARYGGFETAVEEVGQRLATRGHHVTVFCRGADDPKMREYLGMRLVHLPAVKRKVAETLSHTALSVLHGDVRRADVVVLFNAANSPLIPVIRAAGVPVAVHVDGLEWKRSKWGRAGRRYYLLNERLAVLWADRLIADARGIQDYYTDKYSASSSYIPYGAPILQQPDLLRLRELGVERGRYHLIVARFEPENHVDLAMAGYLASGDSFPLLVIGGAPYAAEYVQKLEALASRTPSIRMIGSIWDQDLLDALWAGCLTYIHGHSVGGTNPALLRAMGAGAPVAAYGVNFNREVLADTGRFWSTAEDLAAIIRESEARPEFAMSMGAAGRRRAADCYTWEDVTDGYERLCYELWRRR